MVGCLIWFMSVRPDIMEATSHCTPNMQAPTNKDMSMVKRVYAYLLGTIDKLLTFSQEGMWVEMDMGIPYKTSKQAWSMVAGYVDAKLGRPYSYTVLCYKMGGGCAVHMIDSYHCDFALDFDFVPLEQNYFDFDFTSLEQDDFDFDFTSLEQDDFDFEFAFLGGE